MAKVYIVDETLRVKVAELKKYLDTFDYEGSKKLVDEIK